MPAIVVGLIAYVIAGLFLSIFDFSALAILHCFIVDEDFGGSSKTPDCLVHLLEENDRREAKNNGKVNPK